MHRLTSAEECRKVTDKYPDYFTFDADGWFSNPENYAVQEGDNIGFAELKSPGTYWVHLCCHTARGREAIDLTKKFVDHVFQDLPMRTAVAFVEENNRRTRWLIRQVGFKSLGMEMTKNGLCEMFYLTKGN